VAAAAGPPPRPRWDKTNRSDCSTVNQNSDSVKTFRDKKHRL